MPAPKITAIDVTSGPVRGGTKLRLIGSDFPEGSIVTFGNVVATEVHRESDSELHVTTPPQTSAGGVVVVVSGGGEESNGIAFTYIARVPLGPNLAALWFAYLGAALVFGVYLLVALWPAGAPSETSEVSLFGQGLGTPPEDLQLLLIAGAAGVLGATAYGIIALARWLGVKGDDRAWSGYYFARPFAGFGLAAIVFLVARGGLIVLTTTEGEPLQVDVNAVAALGGLGGLMTMNTLEVLDSVFKSVFRVDGNAAQGIPAAGDSNSAGGDS